MRRPLTADNLTFVLFALLALLLLSLPAPSQRVIALEVQRLVTFPLRFSGTQLRYYAGLKAWEEELFRNRVGQSLSAARLEDLEAENQRLRALLGFKERAPWHLLMAQVISAGLGLPAHTYLIDKGSDDGVREDLPVATVEGLVGKTFSVMKDQTVVLLYTHPGFRAGGLLTRTGEIGIVAPRNRTTLTIQGLSLRSGVQPGDRVVTSGLGGVFPRGIPIGRIVQLGAVEMALMRSAVIQPAVAPDRLLEVAVLLPGPAAADSVDGEAGGQLFWPGSLRSPGPDSMGP